VSARDDRPTYPTYVRKISRWWWTRRSYRSFAAREFTSIFAAMFSAVLLLLLFALWRGRSTWERVVSWLDDPWAIAVASVILVVMLYHTVTWFQLTSQVQVVRLGRRVVPRRVVVAALFVAWLVASALVVYFTAWF
jgi:fumarate reductase subunit C